MQFKTVFSKAERFYCASGEGTRPTYKAEIDKDGDIILVESGIEDTYSKIQSFKDSVDINVILERFAHGDTYALEQSQSFYGDFVEIPRSYMEALNAAIDLRNVYESSDNLDRSKVSFDDFVASVLSPVSNVITDVKERSSDDVKVGDPVE